MPAPLLGPNLGGSSTTHAQPETQSYISNDTNPIVVGQPVVFAGVSPAGTQIVLASTTPANAFAGIALKGGTKGSYIPVAVSGPVRAKTSATPAAMAKLQIDGTGAALTTFSSGQSVGYALEASSGGFATVLIRTS